MTLQTVNAVLAGLACLLVIDKVASMDRQTCHGIRVGAVLLIPGLAAEPLSWLFPGWGAWAATLVYAGLFCYCASDARYRPSSGGPTDRGGFSFLSFSLYPFTRSRGPGSRAQWIVFAALAIVVVVVWSILADAAALAH